MTEPILARASMATEILVAEQKGDKGHVEAIVSAYNVKYRMGYATYHNLKPGTFAESLASNAALPLFWMHAWDWTEQPPIGDGIASEVESPKAGLKVAGDFYLDEAGVKPIFRAMKAGALREWSIGYMIQAYEVDEEDDRVMNVTKAELLEASVVLRGANPETETLKVASGLGGLDMRLLAKVLTPSQRTELAALMTAEPEPPKAKVDVDTSTQDKVEDEHEDDAPPVDTSQWDLEQAAREIRDARNGRRARLAMP